MLNLKDMAVQLNPCKHNYFVLFQLHKELDDLYDKVTARRSYLNSCEIGPASPDTATMPYRKLEMEADMIERKVRQFMNLASQVQHGTEDAGQSQLNAEVTAEVNEVQAKWNNLNRQLESCHQDKLDTMKLQHATASVGCHQLFSS